MSIQEAINWISGQFADTAQKFLDGVRNLPSWGADIDRQVQEYVNGIGKWTRAIDCWEFECGRYFGDKGLEIQQTRKVQLLPKVNRPYRQNEFGKRENVVVPLVEELACAT